MTPMRRPLLRLTGHVVAGSGVGALLRTRRRRRGDFRVFILEYHEIGEGGERDGVVPASRFRDHVRYLKRHLRVSSLADAVRALLRPGGLSEDLAVVTFDDGYAGNYEHAWPILREEGVPATLFLTTGFLDGAELWFDVATRCLEVAIRGAGHLPPDAEAEARALLGSWPPRNSRADGLKALPVSERERLLRLMRTSFPPERPPATPLRWHEVRDMARHGVEIGCHTVTHPILSSLGPADQEREVREASRRIKDETGEWPTLFAYPNGAIGDFDSVTRDILRDAGFLAACTTVRGANSPGCDPYALARLGVGDEPCSVLATRLTGLFDDSVRARLGVVGLHGTRTAPPRVRGGMFQ